jgi:hypothetical protein
MSLYDRDFHAWANEQAALLRARSGNALDWDNVAEELEGLGKQQRSELRSRYEVLLVHLLKWLLQPAKRSQSWRLTITEQRRRIGDHIEENPSLKADDAAIFARAYELARYPAARQTRLSLERMPSHPPFTREQALNADFWPEAGPNTDKA